VWDLLHITIQEISVIVVFVDDDNDDITVVVC
jgi:hypothetical protein